MHLHSPDLLSIHNVVLCWNCSSIECSHRSMSIIARFASHPRLLSSCYWTFYVEMHLSPYFKTVYDILCKSSCSIVPYKIRIYVRRISWVFIIHALPTAVACWTVEQEMTFVLNCTHIALPAYTLGPGYLFISSSFNVWHDCEYCCPQHNPFLSPHWYIC